MKTFERKAALKLDNYNYENFLKEIRREESNTTAWLDNYKPNDNYKFPPEEKPNYEFSECMNTGDISKYKLTSLLQETLIKRKSERINHLDSKWTKDELFELLELGLGLRGDSRWLIKEPSRKVKFRTYPSGGSMYPIKIYICVNNIKGLASSFYRFYPNSHELQRVSSEISVEEYEKLFPMSKYKLDNDNCDSYKSAFSIFFVSNYKYSFPKYGNLAYRLGLLEAGHMAQNLLLITTGMNKKALPVCGLFADEVANKAKLCKNDFVQYGIIFG